MARISPEQAGHPLFPPFLDAIATCELGPALIAASDDGYNVLVGSYPGHVMLFHSYAAHPDVYNAETNSTAAGRYQLLHRYYGYYAKKLGLIDFGPVAQDRIALEQMRERGALGLIRGGHIEEAVLAVNGIWASLPGSPYKQNPKTMEYFMAAFNKAGGNPA